MQPIEAQAIILDPNATEAERLSALDEVANEGPGFFVLRAVLLFDRDALLRARAAERLSDERAAEWLCAAMEDPSSAVREAALGSLGKTKRGKTAAISAVLEDPSWRVRRCAIHALASIAGASAVGTLIGALDDPFWRVRDAAVRSLTLLARDDPKLQVELTSLQGRTDSARAALEQLRRMVSGQVGPALEPPPGRPDGVLFNEDPAVMAARLEDPSFAAPFSELLWALTSPHEPLRKRVIARLREAEDVRVLFAALAWLEDPRIPHAVEAVHALLDPTGDCTREVVLLALSDPNTTERARAWAIGWIGRVELTELADRVRSGFRDRCASVRAIACEAAGRLRFLPDRSLLDDEDERVALAAARVFLERAPHELADRPFAGSVALRRILLAAAIRTDHRERIREASLDADRMLCAAALGARRDLGADERRSFFADPDPWVRLAVLDRSLGAEALQDPDLEVRRAVLGLQERGTPEARAAALAMIDSPDVVSRVRAAELLTADEDAEVLLRLTMDRSLAVRGAASDRLAGIDVRGVLARSLDPIVRKAAFTRWYDSPEDLERALPHETAEVRAHLEAMLIPHRDVSLVEPVHVERSDTSADVVRRSLGRTGMEVAPLAISGVYDLAPGSLLHAFHSGVDTFFWEPRHTSLTRFVRADRSRRDRMKLIAGSFEGSPAGIRRDVERALSRLRTDRIDVFLLFWARSPERLSDQVHQELSRLKASGAIRAFGFSTHDRKLACNAMETRSWDAIMVRHSAAHVGAEDSVFPSAERTGTGIITFSALCYGRMLVGEGAPSAEDCYRYSLGHSPVALVVSAPRRHREMVDNLSVLVEPTLSNEKREAMRAHGRIIHRANKDWAELIRRVPDGYAPFEHSLLDDEDAGSIPRDSELRR